MANSFAPHDRSVSTGPTKRRPWSIAVYLLALALVTLVPSFLFAGTLMVRNQDAQEQTVETLIVATTRSLVQSVEREISANITTLRVLATSDSLHRGDYPTFHAQTTRALEATNANLFVVNPDMTMLLATLRPFGEPLPAPASAEAARRALETGEVVVTNLILGAISQDWVYNILLPVDLGEEGTKIIGLTQQADNISRTLLTNRLPDGWNTALLDEDGQIIAASYGGGVTGEDFSAFDAMSQPFSTGWQRVTSSEGDFMTVIQRSGLTGWRLVSWAPTAVITRPLTEAFLSLIAGGIVLACLIVLALIWVTRRIGSSVRGLARDARRVGRGEGVEAKPYPVTEIAEISAALAEASAQRRSAEADVRFLMRELAHRSKNQMTVIAAMAKQTARGETDVQHYVQNFERRIFGLARSTDLLLTHGRAGVELKELFTHQIEPFAPGESERVRIKGPPVRLNAQSAQTMGMAAHELSTNAVKYGAFSNDSGSLDISWTVEDDTLHFVWHEDSGGPVTHAGDGERIGFGTTVIKSMVGSALNAVVERHCHERGIEWRFAIPLASLDPVRHPEEPGEE